MGEDILMVADPKGIQHILQGSGYNYLKSAEDRQILRMVAGEGLVWVHGEDHRRHRKVMNPAFSAPQLKAFLPLFHSRAEKLVQKLQDEASTGGTDGLVINVASWLSRTTLDVIGEAGFGYEFGALDDQKGEFIKNWDGIFVDSTLYPSNLDLMAKSWFNAIPVNILYYVRHLPIREYRRGRRWLDFARVMAGDIVRKSEARADGKDVMSVLLQANASGNPKTKLSGNEVLDQISTLMLAGTDTTAMSASWVLWELSKDPAYQSKVRDEIRATRAQVTARGDAEFLMTDLEGLTLLQAAMKEGMRLHTVSWHLLRLASKDDVIPLSNPVVTESGEQVTSIPVSKGAKIRISVCAYNRLPSVWGEDADRWNPYRWIGMDSSKQTTVGVYANLLNFSAGVRACIGWRFSVIELQSILVNLLENFEFSLPSDATQNPVLRRPSMAMTPMAEGHRGAWMGLQVKTLA